MVLIAGHNCPYSASRIYVSQKKRGPSRSCCVRYTQKQRQHVADVQDVGRTMYNNLIPIIIGYGKDQ